MFASKCVGGGGGLWAVGEGLEHKNIRSACVIYLRQPPSARELRSLFAVFKGAKDRWKIDNATMKGSVA